MTKAKAKTAPRRRKSKLIDAKTPVVVHITKTDVRMGSLKEASACAAAKAICRQTGCEEARVNIARTYIKKDGKWHRYATPPALRDEIIAFDRGGNFEPGDYTLTPVQPISRLGSRDRREYMQEYNAKPNRNRKAVHRHIVKGVRSRAQQPLD